MKVRLLCLVSLLLALAVFSACLPTGGPPLEPDFQSIVDTRRNIRLSLGDDKDKFDSLYGSYTIVEHSGVHNYHWANLGVAFDENQKACAFYIRADERGGCAFAMFHYNPGMTEPEILEHFYEPPYQTGDYNQYMADYEQDGVSVCVTLLVVFFNHQFDLMVIQYKEAG